MKEECKYKETNRLGLYVMVFMIFIVVCFIEDSSISTKTVRYEIQTSKIDSLSQKVDSLLSLMKTIEPKK